MVFMKLFLLSLGKMLLLFLSDVLAWMAEYRGPQSSFIVNRLGLSPCLFMLLDSSSIGSLCLLFCLRMFSMGLGVFGSCELAMML